MSGKTCTSNGFGGVGFGGGGGDFVVVVDGIVTVIIGNVLYWKVIISLVVTSGLGLGVVIGVLVVVGGFVVFTVVVIVVALVVLTVVVFIVVLLAFIAMGFLVVVAATVVVGMRIDVVDVVDVVVVGIVVLVVCIGTHSGTGKSHIPLSMHDKNPSPLTMVSFVQCTSTNVPIG